MKFSSKIKHLGFTLCEVLIALGIIGIVAENTIPTLIKEFQTQTTVISLKKAYSDLFQAYNLAVQNNGSPDTWGLTADANGAVILLNKFAPYLKIVNNCGLNTGCFPNVMYKSVLGGPYSNFESSPDRTRAQLSDGTSIMFNTSSCTSPILGQIYIDINGFKDPNQLGKDFFYIYINKDKIFPGGDPSMQGTSYFIDHCVTTEGYGCAAWVVYNENLDYLKSCKASLSWTGTTKCP